MYQNAVILAPMVRIGTLPMRLLALRHGADLVYGQELVDHKILSCSRVVNRTLGTVDYMLSNGEVLFRTCAEERKQVIFQIGTCCAERARKVCELVEQDVAGIDVNMGCPKEFSIKGGMGAALLTQPEKIRDILTTLVNSLHIPVTCKIRILPSLDDTLQLVKLIESTGVRAIGVHGRWRDERSSMPCHDDFIRKIAETVSIPVIANGGSLEIKTYDEALKFRESTGASSVMLARSAQWNPSVFRKDGPLPIKDVMTEYMKIAAMYDNVFANTKYVICKMVGDTCGNELGRNIIRSKGIDDIYHAFGLQQFFADTTAKHQKQTEQLKLEDDEPPSKRLKSDDTITMDVAFLPRLYPATVSPIQIVRELAKVENSGEVTFESEQNPKDKMFTATMLMQGKRYSHILSQKRRKWAEQSAAVCFLLHSNIDDGRIK